MLALIAAIVFFISFLLDVFDVAGDLVSTLIALGLTLFAAHFAFGDRLGGGRFGRRD